jgi:hypothetical protein
MCAVNECDECPTCDKCGAPITTGMMALLCPGRTDCEMWPKDGAPEFATMFADKWTADEKQRFREHCERRASQAIG